jgi:hypothetical protein
LNASAEYPEPLDLGVSIADAERIALDYDGNDLSLSFIDWQEVPRRVRFSDAVAFKWQRAEDVREGERFDGAHTVNGSNWLAQHRRQSEAGDEHRHLKLNFNAAGVLEVICLDAGVTE